MYDVKLRNCVFPDGAEILSTTIPFKDVVSAEAHDTDKYRFLFWNLNGTLQLERRFSVDLSALGVDEKVTWEATAWFQDLIANPPPPPPPVGPPRVDIFGVSLIKNRTLPEPPIESVDPGKAWRGAGNVDVSTANGGVTIKAKGSLIFDSSEHEFERWQLHTNVGSTINANKLTVPAKTGGMAIAFYGFPKTVITRITPIEIPKETPLVIKRRLADIKIGKK